MRIRSALISGALVISLPFAGGAAPVFSSGSTGADGPLNVTTNTTLQVQADGVHNYTTINVNAGATLTFTNNATNTPVTFLAQGDVTINGTINLNGQNGRNFNDPLAAQPGGDAQPGPGGYPGGLGAPGAADGGTGQGTSGGGPGGGAASESQNPSAQNLAPAGNGGSHSSAGGIGSNNEKPAAPTYGDPRLITLTGGSGGAGGNAFTTTPTAGTVSQAGGAGGGALMIASSGNITLGPSSTITANGGNGHSGVGFGGGGTHGSGGGAGGAIRLMANNISGTGDLRAIGGAGSGTGGRGRIRLEAFSITGPPDADPPPGSSRPTVVSLAPANTPSITVTTIGGVAVPAAPTGSTTVPDVVIPSNVNNPIQFAITTTNIPEGSVIRLRITNDDGETIETTSGPVNSSGQATASATLPDGFGIVYVTADFTP